MRIKWSAENAREIKRSLEDIRSCLENCMGKSDQIHTAMSEANPDGTNKRLKLLEESINVSMRKVKSLMEEAEELGVATDTMLRLFDDSEAEALSILGGLEEGMRAGQDTGAGKPGGSYPIRTPVLPGRLPIILPTPVIAPMPRLTPYGPVPGWLFELVNSRLS